jgi:cytidylate kinase
MIITVSRQFGSGGREVGKRLADALGYDYYDKEIVSKIAENTQLDEGYVDKVIESGGFKNYAFNFGRSMPLIVTTPTTVTDVLVEQQNVLKKIAESGNCVIVGRSADAILKSFNPFKIFVYADEKSKLERCRQRAPEDEHMTDKQMLKRFKEIDKGRKTLHDLFSSNVWGEKESYDLMINTTNIDIKKIIPAIKEFIILSR